MSIYLLPNAAFAQDGPTIAIANPADGSGKDPNAALWTQIGSISNNFFQTLMFFRKLTLVS